MIVEGFHGPDAQMCSRRAVTPPSLPRALVAAPGRGGKLPADWTHKVCPGCGFVQPRSEFGTQARCKSCKSAEYRANIEKIRVQRRRRYREDPAKAIAKATDWKRRNPERYADYSRRAKYGLAPGRYAQMLAGQDGLCAICRTPHPKPLHVDHCHATGEVRALLCDLCNRGLGFFRDHPAQLDAAATYLRRFQ
jgi:hypothetical protein